MTRLRKISGTIFFVGGTEAGAMPLLLVDLVRLGDWKIALNLNLRHWQQLGRAPPGYFSWGEMLQVYF